MGVGESHHRNPDMDPPRCQELEHHRPLRREHIRILLLILRCALLCSQRPAIIDRLSRRRDTSWIHETLRVRRGTEFVGLGEYARFVGDLLGSRGDAPGLGEAAAGCGGQSVAGVLGCLLEGTEGSGRGEASGKEEGGN